MQGAVLGQGTTLTPQYFTAGRDRYGKIVIASAFYCSFAFRPKTIAMNSLRAERCRAAITTDFED